MALVFFSSPVTLCSRIRQFEILNFDTQKSYSSSPLFSAVHYKFSEDVTGRTYNHFRNQSSNVQKFCASSSMHSNSQMINDVSLEWEDQEQEDNEDMGSPWEGAIIYKRNPAISHMEYCTTLERLGLGKLSTETSKSRASVMGLRVTKAVKDYPNGTPVQISIDVTRKKQKLRLDGIVKTVITLDCNRCGKPTPECIYSNFSLLLAEEPIEEPEIINLFAQGSTSSGQEEDDDEASIDGDDRLFFPSEEKEIDISKQIRDLVHVEITINAICESSCKGICLKCGTNLNTGSCNCSKEKANEKGSGHFKNLRKEMHSKS